MLPEDAQDVLAVPQGVLRALGGMRSLVLMTLRLNVTEVGTDRGLFLAFRGSCLGLWCLIAFVFLKCMIVLRLRSMPRHR